jgi:hypothetical protein
MDQAAFRQSALRNDDNWRNYLGFIYYILQALCPDLYAIRQGIHVLVECEDFDWRYFDIKIQRRIWTEIMNKYPVNFGKVKHFHTGTFANLLASMARQFIPPHIRNKFQMGCHVVFRLDSFYLLPTPEIAERKVISCMEQCLQRRFDNQSSFSL